MTSYSGMAARGREASLERTKGRRKVIAQRIVYEDVTDNVRALPGSTYRPAPTVRALLLGTCGHTLRWLASVNVTPEGPNTPRYLTGQIGRRMTCDHPGCIIPAKPPREPREDDCTWITGKDDEDGNPVRCAVRAQWHTAEGDVCTRHRTYLIEHGYLTEDDGERIAR